MEPGYADGFVNVARARLQEGDTAGAETFLRQALEIDAEARQDALLPGHGAQGAGPLRRGARAPARGRRPSTRAIASCVNQVGRLLFLKRQHQEASAELQKVLDVDPEDLQAHYNLMLAYQGTGERGDGEEAPGALRALQGRRVVAVHHRAIPAAAPARQQRAPADPRAPLGRAPAATPARALSSSRTRRRAARRRLPPGRRPLRPPGPVDEPLPDGRDARRCGGARPRGTCRGSTHRPQARRASSSPTSRAPRASRSATRAAPSARSTCPRRWARACAFFDYDGDGCPGPRSSSTPRAGRGPPRAARPAGALPQRRQRHASPT